MPKQKKIINKKILARKPKPDTRRTINKKIKLNNNYHLSGDRKIIYELSWTEEYRNNKQSLIKRAQTRTGKYNYKYLGLTTHRSPTFVNKWYQRVRPDVVMQQGMGFFDKSYGHKNSGRTRAIGICQMYDLFICYFKTINVFDYGIYTFAANIKHHYGLSSQTIVNYLKLFCKIYKKLKQPHALTAANKRRRLAHCRFWHRMGQDYYRAVAATIDETMVYTETIPSQIKSYMPNNNITCYDDFVEEAQFARFPDNNSRDIAEPAVPANPVEMIHQWTMPPLPFELV